MSANADSSDRFMVLICGGRNYRDYLTLCSFLTTRLPRRPTHVLTGGCRGADALALKWAAIHGIPSSTYMADWAALGKAAGPRRNQAMLDDCHPDLVVAFPGGRGTADMVRRAKIEGVPVLAPMVMP